jgi:protein-L-isoaspartate(D-aspartate) O-methyltransferase
LLSSFCHYTGSNRESYILGCGSGFLTAALGRLVDRNGPILPLSGKVFGIEVFPELVEFSRNNVMKQDKDLLDSGTVDISRGDGWKGKPDEAPYDAIHVGTAAKSFPTNLMMQLNPEGGVMVIPVGPDGGVQNLYKVERFRDNDDFNEHDFNIKALLGVRYVPLIQCKP